MAIVCNESAVEKYMKAFLVKLREVTISGILALLPLYVFLIVISRAWKSLSSVGAGIARILGMQSILGVGGATVFSGLLIIVIWIVTGLLVRFSFLGAVSKAAERQLAKYVPTMISTGLKPKKNSSTRSGSSPIRVH